MKVGNQRLAPKDRFNSVMINTFFSPGKGGSNAGSDSDSIVIQSKDFFN